MKKFLLICFIVTIIVVSVAIGINIYESKLVEDNRNAVIADLNLIASKALEYYEAPIQIGGGDSNWAPKVDGEYAQNRCALWLNFTGIVKVESGDKFSTANGTYKLWLSSWEDKTLKMLGTGLEIGKDGINPVKVRMDLNGPTQGVSITIIN